MLLPLLIVTSSLFLFLKFDSPIEVRKSYKNRLRIIWLLCLMVKIRFKEEKKLKEG